MRKAFTIITFVIFGVASGQSPETMEKIESARIALITQRLDLSPEQAEKFWPVYNEYSKQRLEIHREFQDLKKDFDPNTATEAESKRMLELGMNMKERQLSLDRQYSERMLRIINARQMANLRKAEEDFRGMVLQRVRHNQREQLRDKRMENDRTLDRRRN